MAETIVAPGAGLSNRLRPLKTRPTHRPISTRIPTQRMNVLTGLTWKQRAPVHGRSAGDSVIEAHRAEHAAQDGTSRRAHGDGTHGDGERQEAHVKRAHGHAAQADGFHDQLNGDQQCQPGESTKIVILFHKNISSCCRSALDVGYGANLPAKGAGPFFYFTLECFVRERSKGR